MSASEKLDPSVKDPIDSPALDVTKLAIVAGGGDLPRRLLDACEQQNIEVFIVGFENQTDKDIYHGHMHMHTRIGAAGQIIKTLQSHDISDMVIIGDMRRPTLAELKPDMRTAKFFARLGFQAMGDNTILTALRSELEREGFKIHGVHKFVTDLLTEHGTLTKKKPNKDAMANIARGVSVSRLLGEIDVGQSVIVQEGLVLGVEAIEGTNALIERCEDYQRKGSGPILVKLCKTGQDQDLDLPTLGLKTIELAIKHGLSGIAIEAGASLMVDKDACVKMANAAKIFIIGIQPDQLSHD
jgi:hypothetical protein